MHVDQAKRFETIKSGNWPFSGVTNDIRIAREQIFAPVGGLRILAHKMARDIGADVDPAWAATSVWKRCQHCVRKSVWVNLG